jgi:hypothetical protein
MKKHAIAAIALCAAAAAGAQTIYRCGNSYSEDPCAGATVVAVAPAPSAAEAAATRDEVRREAQLADEMHAARIKEEALHKAAAPARKAAERAHAKPAKLVVARTSPAKQDKKPAKKKSA